MSSIKTKFFHLSEMVMMQHSIFSLPFIFISMLVASNGWFGWKLFILGVLAAVSARNFAMGINRYFDRDIDALNPRTQNRPSVDGRVSQGLMIGFIVGNAFAFIVVAFFINALALKLSLPILLILGGYTFFKRFSSMAHIILGVSLGLAPIAGEIAVSETISIWTLYLSGGVIFWVAGFDLLYSLQDIDFDKEHNLHSIPSQFGAKKTMLISKLFHLMTIVLWGLFIYYAGLGLYAKLAVVLSAIMLTYEHYLVSKDFTKIDRAFFTVNGYLGILFLFLIILEVM